MFIRKKFVSNSSTTSFVFFGIEFNEDGCMGLLEKILPPEELNREKYERMDDILYDWTEKLYKLKSPILVHLEYEFNSGVVYIRDSYIDMEGGVGDLPLTKIAAKQDKIKQWVKDIKRFCEEHGIVPHKGYNSTDKPTWKVAMEIQR